MESLNGNIDEIDNLIVGTSAEKLKEWIKDWEKLNLFGAFVEK